MVEVKIVGGHDWDSASGDIVTVVATSDTWWYVVTSNIGIDQETKISRFLLLESWRTTISSTALRWEEPLNHQSYDQLRPKYWHFQLRQCLKEVHAEFPIRETSETNNPVIPAEPRKIQNRREAWGKITVATNFWRLSSHHGIQIHPNVFAAPHTFLQWFFVFNLTHD